MSAANELLLLRLGLIAIIFLFVFVTAMTMRSGLRTTIAFAGRGATSGVARLVLVVPGETRLAPGTEFVIAGEMTIGRDAANGIALGDPSVSGVHARVERVGGRWKLTDLGSTNGTTVNGQPVSRRGVLLRGPADVTLGTIVLRFQP
ncbi:MAG: FHA domain-containing protein [Tepidiformaceae bacterium]